MADKPILFSGPSARVICAACGWRGRRKAGQIVTCPCCGMIATYEVER